MRLLPISSREPIIDFWRQMRDKQVLFGGSARALFVQSPLESSTSMLKRLDRLVQHRMIWNVQRAKTLPIRQYALPGLDF